MFIPYGLTALGSIYVGIAGFFTGSPQHFWVIPGTWFCGCAAATAVNRCLYGVNKLQTCFFAFVIIACGAYLINELAGWVDQPCALQLIPTCLATGAFWGLSTDLKRVLDQ